MKEIILYNFERYVSQILFYENEQFWLFSIFYNFILTENVK